MIPDYEMPGSDLFPKSITVLYLTLNYNLRMPDQIAVNARFLWRRITGVERYAHEITTRLDGRIRLLAPTRPVGGISGHLWEQTILPNMLRRGDLLWSPSNSGPLFVPNQVLSLHDLAFIEYPEWFDPKFAGWYRFLIPRLINKVNLLITPSYYTKIRILDTFWISPDKVKVVPPGVNPDLFRPSSIQDQQQIRNIYGLDDPYCLVVGSLEPRKNLGNLFQAWELSRAAKSGLHLIVAGSGGQMFRRVDTGHLPGRIHLIGAVSDPELVSLYSGAKAYILPSLYEGFGLTVLEAMACGAPVIASKAGAIPETAGEAAIYFNPVDVEEIAQTIDRVLEDSELQETLRAKGLERAREFSWDNAAEKIWILLQGVQDEG
jgi:glycosyltransferase involved in cell wall biosynthesis